MTILRLKNGAIDTNHYVRRGNRLRSDFASKKLKSGTAFFGRVLRSSLNVVPIRVKREKQQYRGRSYDLLHKMTLNGRKEMC